MPSLLTIFPEPKNLLALEPEELAGILVEIIPSISQHSGFLINNFLEQLSSPHGGGYPPTTHAQVAVALAEAMSWLETQGIIVRNPNQPAEWYLLTRRGQELKSRADLETFRKGRALPFDLLQQSLASKVHHLFLRGDHDTAVFQAFKEVEVSVRKAGNFPDSLTGRDLMVKAFNVDTGPLRDKALIPAERESEMFLFSGAIGHAKNPTSHRNVNLTREEAARLIVFASHLLDIVEQRANILTTQASSN
jgi:uncharacterized protein (TIGR02391 family)